MENPFASLVGWSITVVEHRCEITTKLKSRVWTVGKAIRLAAVILLASELFSLWSPVARCAVKAAQDACCRRRS